SDEEGAKKAIEMVQRIAAEAEVGRIYKGTVRKIVEFGAFVEILPGTDGLVHISQLAPERVRKVTDVLKEGDEVMVKVLEIDRQGKIRLSRKEALQETGGDDGIRVVSQEMPEHRSVSLGIWVENGSRHESAAENGLSHFIEHLLFKGTARRSAAQIAEEMDAVGGVLNAFTAKEHTCYYAKVLDENLPLAIDLLTDIFL